MLKQHNFHVSQERCVSRMMRNLIINSSFFFQFFAPTFAYTPFKPQIKISAVIKVMLLDIQLLGVRYILFVFSCLTSRQHCYLEL